MISGQLGLVVKVMKRWFAERPHNRHGILEQLLHVAGTAPVCRRQDDLTTDGAADCVASGNCILYVVVHTAGGISNGRYK